MSRLVDVGDEFRYVFDFGDDWTHACTVTGLVDPREVLGVTPRRPSAYFGWGSVPDQYGRRWADDPGEGPVPQRPAQPHPMLAFGWPGEKAAPPLDQRELLGAVARGDVPGIVAAVEGHDIDDALQQVGSAWQLVLAAEGDQGEGMAVSLYNRLTARRAAGDEILAEDLLALLRGTPVEARHLPVDLVELAGQLDGPEDQETGVLDLTSGEVLPGFLADPAMVGEDAFVDFEEEPDRWLEIERLGSRDGWRDMADFAAGVTNGSLRERLERSLEGRGAFRRFRDLVHDEGLGEAWHRFSDDRGMGRAREFLAEHGIRATPG